MEQSAVSKARDWEDPTVYQRNRCRPHVPLRSFPSSDEALRSSLLSTATARHAAKALLQS